MWKLTCQCIVEIAEYLDISRQTCLFLTSFLHLIVYTFINQTAYQRKWNSLIQGIILSKNVDRFFFFLVIFPIWWLTISSMSAQCLYQNVYILYMQSAALSNIEMFKCVCFPSFGFSKMRKQLNVVGRFYFSCFYLNLSTIIVFSVHLTVFFLIFFMLLRGN